MQPHVLLFSASTDWSALRIAEALDRRGLRHSWLDPAGFPTEAIVSATLEGDRWKGRYEAHGVGGPDSVRWEDLTAVHYRRPRDFQLPDAMSAPERKWCRAQARVGLGGILASLRVRWVDHPWALADAEYKPRQLALAARLGFDCPPTLITTSAEDVRAFADRHGALITKPLATPIVAEAGGQTITATRRVDVDDLDGIQWAPHLFQPELPKDHELRMTVVGRHVFTVGIHAESDAARLDWRTDYDNLTYTVMEPPGWVVDRAREYLRCSGLVYGAFDLVVDGDRIWWLECNAAGQWGWLAEECGLPIPDAFADTLIEEPSR